MRFRAVIHQNKRDIYMSPKVLLTSIFDISTGIEFRDHCWVNISNKISKFIPEPGDGGPNFIEFDATPFTYLSSEGYKQGLNSIKHISYV